MIECPDDAFYSRTTTAVAKELIGMKLVRTLKIKNNTLRLAGTIVETEAYGHNNDKASHARIGPTSRNAVMFGGVGIAYIYFTYGNHYCVNVSAKSKREIAGAVLIRAIEPIEGVNVMREYRAVDSIFSLGSGPGKLTQALNITSMLNGADMKDPKSELHIEFGTTPKEIISTPRIGITRATERNWRFIDPSSRYLSKMQIKVR